MFMPMLDAFAFSIAFPGNGARNACWRFLAKLLKIEF
jgi:hypothetical protein